MTFFKKRIRILLLSMFLANSLLFSHMSDDEILMMLEQSLTPFPEKIKVLPAEIRRVGFYTLRADSKLISIQLLKQIQGKIEALFLEFPRPILVYAPELKLIKIVSEEDKIVFTSGLQTTEEIKSIGEKLKLDGLLEGELYLSKTNLFLNLRIFDTQNLSIVWSEEFSSKLPPKPALTICDIGLGGKGIQLSQTSTTGKDVPSFADYYTGEFRIMQKTSPEDKMRFIITMGFNYLYQGIIGKKTTIVSYKTTPPINVFFRTGIRVSVIQREVGIDMPKRNWLSVEFSLGRIFTSGISGLTTFGLQAESEITKDISVSAGISFAPPIEVEFEDNRTVKAGGLIYEISLFRYRFTP